MDTLMKHYKEKIQALRNETMDKIREAEKLPAGDFIMILTGKMMALDLCIKELELIENYQYKSELNK